MDRQIRRLGAALLVLFLALFVQINYLQVFAAEDLANNPGNTKRLLIQQFDVDRGDIRARDNKTILATSEPTEGEFKYQRTYPQGQLYAGVTGFYSVVSPAIGIERSFDEYLSGRADDLLPQRFVDEIRGRDRRGADVVTTIDPRLQRVAREALGDQRGGVAAIDPQTGEVLALVSNPSYNPNQLAVLNVDAAAQAYEDLQPEATDSLLHPIASSRLFPPGSTFKVVTAAAALESGNGPNSLWPNPPELDLPNTEDVLRNFGDSHCLGGASQITLAQALQVSCNVTFGGIGMELGAEPLLERAEAFGFNGDIESAIPFAEGRLPPESLENDPAAQAKSAIGQQSVQANPLHMAMVAGAVANGGTLMAPQVVLEVRDPSGSIVRSVGAEEVGEAMSAANAADLTAMMEAVVASGTGQSAQIPGVRVAGKTGTAQQGNLEDPPHVWFVGFAPADDPQIAVAVVVLEGGAQGTEATGGVVAAPIAKAVMEAALGAGQ